MLNAHNASVTTATDDELVILGLAISARHCLCESYVIELPHVVNLPKPLQRFARLVGIGAKLSFGGHMELWRRFTGQVRTSAEEVDGSFGYTVVKSHIHESQ